MSAPSYEHDFYAEMAADYLLNYGFRNITTNRSIKGSGTQKRPDVYAEIPGLMSVIIESKVNDHDITKNISGLNHSANLNFVLIPECKISKMRYRLEEDGLLDKFGILVYAEYSTIIKNNVIYMLKKAPQLHVALQEVNGINDTKLSDGRAKILREKIIERIFPPIGSADINIMTGRKYPFDPFNQTDRTWQSLTGEVVDI